MIGTLYLTDPAKYIGITNSRHKRDVSLLSGILQQKEQLGETCTNLILYERNCLRQ